MFRWLLLVFGACCYGAPEEFALVGARIYSAPTEAPIDSGVIVIRDGKIASVGTQKVRSKVRTIDCKGKTIVAGFWNNHVHFTEPKWDPAATLPAKQLTEQLQEMFTRYGFTTVVDTGSAPMNTQALRKRIESGDVAGPKIFTAGSPLYPKNGVPFYVVESFPPDILKLLAQPGTPEEAVHAVRDQIAQGADLIKLFVVSWVRRDGKIRPFPMDLEIAKAAVAEAHRQKKLVFAHPSTVEGLELVLKSGVDVLAHTTEDPELWTDALVSRLKAADVSLVPTLTLFSRNRDFENIQKEVKMYSAAGGRIMFGTDIGYLADYPVLAHEFELLDRAGLTFPEILAALTTAPANRFGLSTQTGRIAPGMNADLVVLDGDPAQEVKAWSKVAMTLRVGKVLYRATSSSAQ